MEDLRPLDEEVESQMEIIRPLKETVDKLQRACLNVALMAKEFAESVGDEKMLEAAESLIATAKNT